MFTLFMGDKFELYPKKQFYTDGQLIKPMQGNYNKARTSAILEVVNSEMGRKLIKTLSNQPRGGTYEGDPVTPDYSGKTPKKGNQRGDNSKGNNRNGRNRGNRRSNFSESDGSVRGYIDVPGISCLLFSSGVNSGLTVNTRIVAKDYSPIYLSSGWFFKVTDPNVNLETEFERQLGNIIYPLIESGITNKIQRYAGRYIHADDFSNYIKALVTALQIYYCLDNVLSYGSNINISNINVGMEHLRSKLIAETIVEYNLLKETLCTCNCPTNLLNYIRFMCQSYRTSSAPHSPIIKLNIGGMFDSDWIRGSRYITDLVSQARSDLIKQNKMVSYLNQAYPNWIITSLPASASEACFNHEFFTFWHNQNCTYLSTKSTNNGNFEYTINVNDIDAYTDYQIIQSQEEVDGVIFVSQTYNIPDGDGKRLLSKWGVWQPLAMVEGKNIQPGNSPQTFNIKCFTIDGLIKSCINDVSLGASGICNLVTYKGAVGNWQAVPTKFGSHGFVKLQNVSVRFQTEAFNNTMRFWFMNG